jgi:hypothetical protein
MNRVWTYIISRQLDESQLRQLVEAGEEFVQNWTAHENKLKATFRIYYGRIIIVTVNENINMASGCSIDKLTRFIQQLELKYDVELMNRMLVAYKEHENLNVTTVSSIPQLLNNKNISEDTIVFNTAAATQNELAQWEQPLKNTWLKKYLN